MSNIEWIVELREFPEYFISTRGRVFSDKFGKMKEMKPGKDFSGYLMIGFWKEGKRYTKHIHRLVCETFLERVEGKNEIDHINRINTDNRLENLKWCNHRENMINRGLLSNNTSGIKGVSFRKDCDMWRTDITIEENKRIRKNFKTKEEAILWRLEMEQKYYK